MTTDITPEDSVVPVHLDTTPLDPIIIPDGESPFDIAKTQEELRDSGIAKLVQLGLTEDQAKAIAGI